MALSRLQRLLRSGTTDTDPPQRARLVVVVNVMILCEAVSAVTWLPAGLSRGDLGILAVVLVMCILSAIAWILNRRRRLYASAVFLGSTAWLIMTTQVVLWGTNSGIQYYFILGVVVPFLVFSREHEITAISMAAVNAATFVALIVFADQMEPLQSAPLDPQTMFTSNLIILMGLLAAVAYYSRRTTLEAEHVAQVESEKSEALLLNVLPKVVADRLKAGEPNIADSHPTVSVIFADLVGFTPLAATMSAEELVILLNDVFARFDEAAAERGVEKIKTIGDAYMAAVGVPEPRPDHAQAAIAFARDMLDHLERVNEACGTSLQLRVGIHSGAVVAGVIGRHKFSYDLWGDVVNVASRMESHGVPGRVQISSATAELLGDGLEAEPRHSVEVKGRGPMPTFLI